ncbi:phosphate ABC transporter substrate-binding protein [bacterium]|nr:phosphate ABC transporter substrate-binding protein [bacterium]
MRRNLFVLTILIVVGALAFSACQPDLNLDTEQPTATEEASDPGMDGLSGQVQIAGSTTVQPLAEVLAEAFMADNADVTIEVQGGGSSVGVTSAGEGTVDIGNASRNVKESEFEEFPELQVFTIAYDGIAIVTNPDLALPSLSIGQVKAIFAGDITNYSEVGGPDAEIVVVSREEGSGTRAAFEELVMESGDTEAAISENALLQQSNGQVRTTVSTTPDTIGYLSFGFLDESISTVAIDDVDPTVANVKNGSYPIFRPLNMLTNGEPNELAQAFLDFILSAAGQEIVAEEYITVTDEEAAEEEEMSSLSGQIQIAGSTTVQPLAEVLAEAFMAENADVTIEVQGGGSSVGVTSAGEGTVDIGEASRNVKDSEFETFPELQVFTIAYDGIAIVTNPDLELPSLSIEQVQAIFAGEITNYADVGGPDAEIVVVSREEGSGTRAAFEELVMEANDSEAVISETALLQQSNGQVRTTVSTTPDSIGYLSFGFLDESVSPVAIDDVAPSVANVKNGSYPIFRPLNMLTNGEPNELAQAFLDFILSDTGQEIVAEDYITVTEEEVMEESYTPPTDLSGQIQLAGSTTVQPLAEVLAEAFMGFNADLMIEVQGGGSSVGVTSAGEGTVDIGEASRNIKDSEFETFPELQVFTIAYDGIAIVTNPDLELETLSIEQVQAIFAGEITNFADVGGPDAEIVVVSREEGSGTRAAFEELVMEANDSEAVISETALLQQSNGQVRTTVSTTPDSIGFLSFGFLDESINAVPIDGVAPTVENVKAGDYSIYRPLNMLTNGAPNELAQAFLDYILSPMGQEIVAEDYITVN